LTVLVEKSIGLDLEHFKKQKSPKKNTKNILNLDKTPPLAFLGGLFVMFNWHMLYNLRAKPFLD
jgi:hypothetical protein